MEHHLAFIRLQWDISPHLLQESTALPLIKLCLEQNLTVSYFVVVVWESKNTTMFNGCFVMDIFGVEQQGITMSTIPTGSQLAGLQVMASVPPLLFLHLEIFAGDLVPPAFYPFQPVGSAG